MKKFRILILLLLIVNFSFSQTIINAERLISGADSSIYAVSASYNGTRGNSTTDRIDISPSILLIRKRNDYKFFGGYNLLSKSNNKILNSGFFHLRHNYKITDRIKTFEFYQLQFNDALLLIKREVFGAGLRLGIVKKDSAKLDFSFGLMRELEVLNTATLGQGELSETDYIRATTLCSINLLLGKKMKINNVIYYQPYLKDFTDFRILNDFAIAFSITNHFDLITSITTRFDSDPPGHLEKLDNVISSGVIVKF